MSQIHGGSLVTCWSCGQPVQIKLPDVRMKIDILDDENIWIQVIHYLYLDQGLDTPTSMEWELSEELFIAARFLKTLSNKEICTFCIGDNEDMLRIIEHATDKEGAEAAHRVLDAMFNQITGVEEEPTDGEERTIPDPQSD